MPHLDFRRLFSTTVESPLTEQLDAATQQKPAPEAAERPKRKSLLRMPFGRSQWLPIIFATVTFVGGLFCVFRFSSGPEILRSVTAWPREFLYPRPLPANQHAKIDITSHADRQVEPLTAQSMKLSDRGEKLSNLDAESLNPSPSLTSPGPDNTNFSSANSGSSSSPIQASRSPSAQTAPSHSPHGTASSAMHDAHHTVVVVTTHVSASKHHHSEQTKEKTHRAKETATKLAACKQTVQSSRQSSSAAQATKNHAASAIRSTNNLGHQSAGIARGQISNPGASFRGPAGFSGGGHH